VDAEALPGQMCRQIPAIHQEIRAVANEYLIPSHDFSFQSSFGFKKPKKLQVDC
jgi:hypothetical protein